MKAFYNPIFILTIVAGLTLLSGCTGVDRKKPFRAGTCMIEMTPKSGYPQEQGGLLGVKSPLYVKALVFSQGEIRGAILMCDLAVVPRDLSRLVRMRVARETGIPFQHICVAATHIHTGPHHDSIVHDAHRFALLESEGRLTQADHKAYFASLIDTMTKALVTAGQNLTEVQMTTGIGQATGISFNRRYLMTDGRVRFNPGYQNPDILEPLGPVDPDVHFILFRPESKDNYAYSLTVFAEHTDTEGGTDFSADYPHYLQEELQETFGDGFISVFGNGPCGNINHIDVSHTEDSTRQGMITGKIGKTIASAIREALPAGTQNNPALRITSKTIYLPLQDISEKELQWAREESKPLYPERPFMENMRRWKILDIERMRKWEAIAPAVSGEPWVLPVEIQAFCLDDETAIVTFPGEVFVEHGLELKKRSPFANTMLIELANAWIKYIPDLKAYSQGDYEALNSRLVPGSGEKMVDEAAKLLEELKSGLNTN